jgi:hypothetical protein
MILKKLIVLGVMFLALVAATGAAWAAPGENSPWIPTGNDCDHPSTPAIGDGVEYLNTQSGKTHCFKA